MKNIIAKAKLLKSYTNNSKRMFSENQQQRAAKMIPAAIKECEVWQGKRNGEDSYSPFDKLARLLGRAKK